ncbi:TetR/AcrR family transcriptional regulator [Streptomyces xantholiticus]|uniref:TetR/AcrR family transcriptional regulator n=1 Tax=Streptomyces xantholiticus TaxID=68285 RepID=UPI0019845C24|nr:TetR family transcriptional regulator [Streptomyces xantholiticus]
MPATPPLPFEQHQRPMGLRERKKLKTRIAIRKATYRLIAEQGYDATTIEQIAAAAEVSPSTVFRYFPTKEDIVLTDEYDPVMEAALRARPGDEPPLESLRAVLTGAVASILEKEPEEMGRRTRLMLEVPALRARMTETMAETSSLLARPIADRAGREPDDPEVRVFTAAVMGALREALFHWGERGRQDDLVALVDRTLDVLKGGLRL